MLFGCVVPYGAANEAIKAPTMAEFPRAAPHALARESVIHREALQGRSCPVGCGNSERTFPFGNLLKTTRGACIRVATSSDSTHNVCCLGKDDGVSILILCQCFPRLIGQLSSSLFA